MSNTADGSSERDLSWDEAEARFRKIVADGDIDWTDHALQALKDDGLQTTDFMNALRGGRINRVEVRHGQVRYCVSNRQMTAVVSLASDTELCAITAWRNDA